MYNSKTIEYYNKINYAPLWDQTKDNVITIKVGDLSSGEVIIFQYSKNQGDLCRYKVLGCGYMIGLVVWLAETLENEGLLLLKSTLTVSYLCEFFQLPKVKTHCAIRVLDIIEQILVKQ